MTDLKDKFDAYRARAMAANEGPFAAMSAGYAALKALIRDDWPEIGSALAADSVRYREVGHGHRDGSLVELVYSVGTEALGWRTYEMTYNQDSRAWVPTKRAE